jgi:hypothetical protein
MVSAVEAMSATAQPSTARLRLSMFRMVTIVPRRRTPRHLRERAAKESGLASTAGRSVMAPMGAMVRATASRTLHKYAQA